MGLLIRLFEITVAASQDVKLNQVEHFDSLQSLSRKTTEL